MKTYSQNNEQHYILEYFAGKKTEFLEIGAYHPEQFSNTRALVELGWGGVYVEPSPKCFKTFEEFYPKDKFPQIELLNVLIGAEDKDAATFYESNGDAISTTDPAHRDKWEKGWKCKFDEIKVPMMGMKTLLDNYGGGVEFLNLDVESTNIALFNLIDDDFWKQIKMLCIEHDGQQAHIIKKLGPLGFRELHRNGENLIMVK